MYFSLQSLNRCYFMMNLKTALLSESDMFCDQKCTEACLIYLTHNRKNTHLFMHCVSYLCLCVKNVFDVVHHCYCMYANEVHNMDYWIKSLLVHIECSKGFWIWYVLNVSLYIYVCFLFDHMLNNFISKKRLCVLSSLKNSLLSGLAY